jgi:SecD/SecF fusion protein
VLRTAPLLAIVLGALALAGCGGGGGDTSTSAMTSRGCASAPEDPGTVLVYRLTPYSRSVTAADQAETMRILCSRLRAIGLGEGRVAVKGQDELAVTLPAGIRVGDGTPEVGASGRLYFYDWEPSLIGREYAIAGHPGRQPPQEPLREAEKEWKEAGRAPDVETRQLIYAGAFPTAYAAAKLASEQTPAPCAECSRDPSFYLFSKDPDHKLIAGPTNSRDALYADGRSVAGRGEVVELPVGTAVVSELPVISGVPAQKAEPGWYALSGEPALTGAEITHPEARVDGIGEPTVVFEFTSSGQEAFHEVTRHIAQRGQEQAIGISGAEEAAALSGHFAVVLDNEVKTRPIINFAENPDGIDGRTGAQISGGFSGIRQAKELAAVLRTGILPVQLILLRQSPAG